MTESNNRGEFIISYKGMPLMKIDPSPIRFQEEGLESNSCLNQIVTLDQAELIQAAGEATRVEVVSTSIQGEPNKVSVQISPLTTRAGLKYSAELIRLRGVVASVDAARAKMTQKNLPRRLQGR